MATVNKDFKIKYGLIVEGPSGTINGFDILTKSETDQDYIINLIGGSATSEATADTVVLRDANADFAANDITVNEISIQEIGRIYEDDNDLIISNTDESDVIINADDIRLNATDDIRLTSGTGSDIVLSADSGVIRFEAPNIYAGENLQYVDSEKVATRGRIDSLIGDNTVDGTTGNTITDRIASASGDLTDHENATEAHGATGAVVGTTNEQTLTNKTISYTDNTLTVQVANVSDLTATASELNVLDGITASTSELNILDGVTADYTELNVLDGITASTSELNILDGATLTTTELNYVDGVTSGIQNQINDKAPLESPALTGTPTAPTASAGTDSTQVATTAFVQTAVANLVDGAPELLDTLNELAAALGDDENFASSIGTSIGEKVAKSGDTMTGALTLSGAPTIDLHAATKAYVDTAESDANSTASGYVSDHSDLTTGVHGVTGDVVGTSDSQTLTNKTIDASSNTLSNIANSSLTNSSITVNGYSTALGETVTLDTDDVSEGTAQYFTQTRARESLSAGNAISYDNGTGVIAVDASQLDSDDIEEGATNLYHTSARAKSAAAELLTGALLTNITITGSGSGLTITAENGVADSDTDDLTEGSSNLYFTDERVIDAVDNADITPNSVQIDTFRKEEATQTLFSSASTATVHSFGYPFGSVKYLVRVVGTVSGTLHSQIVEILATVDGNNNVAVTEYGSIHTTEPALASFTVDYDIASESYRLRATSTGTMEVVVAATLLSWAD